MILGNLSSTAVGIGALKVNKMLDVVIGSLIL